MLERRVANRSIKEIAEEFRCHVNTVYKGLNYAIREGLTREYENQLIGRLVPEALRVYEEKLKNENDVFVAKDVIDKMVKLGDRFTQKESHQEELSLKAYVERKKIEKASSDDVIVTVPGVVVSSTTVVNSDSEEEIDETAFAPRALPTSLPTTALTGVVEGGKTTN